MKAEAIVIQRPDRQTVAQKAMFAAVTVIAWLFWAFLWLPLITLGAWAFGLRSAWVQFYVSHRLGDGGDIDVVFIVAVVCAVVFMTWSGYNRARFTGKQKRLGNQPFSVAQTAAEIGATTEDAIRIQAHRRAVVSVSEAGFMTVDDAR